MSGPRRRIPSRLLPMVALLVATQARAQDPAAPPATQATQPPITPGSELAKPPFWSGGRARPFAAATLELGTIYYRPLLALGYGKPHWRWGGVEIGSSLSVSGGW